MMRRIPYTLLVCLVFLMSTAFMVPAWASPVEDSAEKILAKSQAAMLRRRPKPKAITKVKRPAASPTCEYLCPRGLTKVKPGYMRSYATEAQFPAGILPPRDGPMGHERRSSLCKALRGKVAWPRYAWASVLIVAGGTNETDFTDGLRFRATLLSPHGASSTHSVPIGRCGTRVWGSRPMVAASHPLTSRSDPGSNSMAQARASRASISISISGWASSMMLIKSYRSCSRSICRLGPCRGQDPGNFLYYTGQSAVFSKGTDAAIAGIEYQRFVKATANGAHLSCDCKAGAIFLDDVVGVDAQAGAQYAISLNSGRSGYVKAGYRLVELKKPQTTFCSTTGLRAVTWNLASSSD